MYVTLGAIWVFIGIGCTLMGYFKPEVVYIGVFLALILVQIGSKR